MKKIFYILFSILGIGIVASCNGNGNKGNEDEEDSAKVIVIDSISVPSIYNITGVVGDGTSMNVLELVTDNGDTLLIECPSEMVVGGVEVGDLMAVTYNSNGETNSIMTSINLSALQHLWTQKGADGRSQSLEIDEDGRAVTYDMSVEYNAWSLVDGKLLLHSPKKVASEQAAMVDTFEIMELNDEHLVLMHGELATEFVREN